MHSIYSLDINRSGADSITATTDGVLLLRYLKGEVGQALIRNIATEGAGRTDAIEIKEYLDVAVRNGGFDADGDGIATENDGHLIFVFLLNRDKNGTVNSDELTASYADLGIDTNGKSTLQIINNINAMLIPNNQNPTTEHPSRYPTPGQDGEFNDNFLYDRNLLSDTDFFKYFVFESASQCRVAASYPGTIIYEEDFFGGNRKIVQATETIGGVATPLDTSKPYSGTLIVQKDKVYYGTNPIHLTVPGEHNKIAPFKLQGRKFGYANAKGSPNQVQFYFVALQDGTVISVYENGDNGGFTVDSTKSISLNAGQTKSRTFTSNFQNWTLFKSNKPVLITAENQAIRSDTQTDKVVLAPARSYVYIDRQPPQGLTLDENGNSIPPGGRGVGRKDNVVFKQNTLLWAQVIGDGKGFDAAVGIGLNELSKNFSWGDTLVDYRIVAPRNNTTVKISYWNGSSWVLFRTQEMGAATVTNPATVFENAAGSSDDSGRAGLGKFASDSTFTANLWKFEATEEIMLLVNDSREDEEQLIGWSDENFGAEIKPSYGSSISFRAENSSWYGGEYDYHISPLGLNSLKADINLSFVGSSKDMAPVISVLESLSSKPITGDVAASGGLECLNFGELIGSNSISLDTDYYNNFSGSLLENFSIRDLSDDTYEIKIKLFNDSVSPFLANGNGFVVDSSVDGFSGEFNKFDIIKENINSSKFDNYFYCESDGKYNGLPAPLSGLTTYTGSFENFTRTFFFEPDQQIQTSFDQSSEVLKLKGSKSSKNTLSNNKNLLKSLTLNFTNRTQKETQCILHFLESHLGYKTFFYNFNNNLITKNKMFICENWSHTFNYKDSNNITATFKEIPTPQNIFFDNTVVPVGTVTPDFAVQSNEQVFGTIDIVLRNKLDLNLASTAYQWEVTSDDGATFLESTYRDSKQSRYMIKPEEAGSGIRGTATVFDQQGEEFTFTSDVINVQPLTINGETSIGSEINLSNRGVGLTENLTTSVVDGDLNITYHPATTTDRSAVSNIEDLQQLFSLDTSDNSTGNFLTAVHPTGLNDYNTYFVWQRSGLANTHLSQSADSDFALVQEIGNPFNDSTKLTGNAANYIIENDDGNSELRCVTMSFFKSSTDLGQPRIKYEHDDLSNPGNRITGYLYAFTGSAKINVPFENLGPASFSLAKSASSVPSFQYYRLSGSNVDDTPTLDRLGIGNLELYANDVEFPDFDMTQNEQNGIKVSAGYSYGNHLPFKAFDSNVNTYWWTALNGDPNTQWIQIELPSAEPVTGINIKLVSNHDGDRIHILASNDESFNDYVTWGIISENAEGMDILNGSFHFGALAGKSIERGIKYTVSANNSAGISEEVIVNPSDSILRNGDTIEVLMTEQDPDGLSSVGTDYSIDATNHTITWLSGQGSADSVIPGEASLQLTNYQRDTYGSVKAKISYTDGKGFEETVTTENVQAGAPGAFKFLVDTSLPVDYHGVFMQANRIENPTNFSDKGENLAPSLFGYSDIPNLAPFSINDPDAWVFGGTTEFIFRGPAPAQEFFDDFPQNKNILKGGGYENSAFHILSGAYDLEEPLTITLPVVVGGLNTINDINAIVSWGDANSTQFINSSNIDTFRKVSFQNDQNIPIDMYFVTHTYDTNGIYEVTIQGSLPIHYKYVGHLEEAIFGQEIPDNETNFPALWAEDLDDSKYFKNEINPGEVVVQNYGNRIIEILSFGTDSFDFKNHRNDSNPIQNLQAIRSVPNLNDWSGDNLNCDELFNNCYELRELHGVPFSGTSSSLSYYKNCHNLTKYTINANGQNNNFICLDFSTVGDNKATNRIYEVDLVDMDKCETLNVGVSDSPGNLSDDGLVVDQSENPNCLSALYRGATRGTTADASSYHSKASLSIKNYYEIFNQLHSGYQNNVFDYQTNTSKNDTFPKEWYLGEAEDVNFVLSVTNEFNDTKNTFNNADVKTSTLENESILGFMKTILGVEKTNTNNRDHTITFRDDSPIYEFTIQDFRQRKYKRTFAREHKIDVSGDGFVPISPSGTEMNIDLGVRNFFTGTATSARGLGGIDAAGFENRNPNILKLSENLDEIEKFQFLVMYSAIFDIGATFQYKYPKGDTTDNGFIENYITGSISGDVMQKFEALIDNDMMGGNNRRFRNYDSIISDGTNNINQTNEQIFDVKDYLDFSSEVVSENVIDRSDNQVVVKRITKYSWAVKEVFEANTYSEQKPYGVRYGPSFDGTNYEFIKYDDEVVSKGLLVNNYRQVPTGQFGKHLGGENSSINFFNTTLNPGVSQRRKTSIQTDFYQVGLSAASVQSRLGGQENDNITMNISGRANPNRHTTEVSLDPQNLKSAEVHAPLSNEINYQFKNLMSDGYFKNYKDMDNPFMSGTFNPLNSDAAPTDTNPQLRDFSMGRAGIPHGQGVAQAFADANFGFYSSSINRFTIGAYVSQFNSSALLLPDHKVIGNYASFFGGALGQDPSIAVEGRNQKKYFSAIRNHQCFIRENNFDDYYRVETIRVSAQDYDADPEGTVNSEFETTLTKNDFSYKQTNNFKVFFADQLSVTQDDDGVIIEFVPKFNQVSSRIFTSTLVLPYDNLHDTNFANGTTRNKDIQLNDDFIES